MMNVALALLAFDTACLLGVVVLIQDAVHLVKELLARIQIIQRTIADHADRIEALEVRQRVGVGKR